MQRAVVQAALAATILIAAGCGTDTSAEDEAAAGSSSATPSSAQALDGGQSYGSLHDLYSAITGVGATARQDLRQDSAPAAAKAQGRCSHGDGELVLQLWDDASARDDGTTTLITALGDIGYCFVLGRDDGAWSINAGGPKGLEAWRQHVRSLPRPCDIGAGSSAATGDVRLKAVEEMIVARH